jgi:hypothetical protein
MTETTNAKRVSPSVARGLPLRRKLDGGYSCSGSTGERRALV